MVSMTVTDIAREQSRHPSGRFGLQPQTAPELELDAETAEQAGERGVADARSLRTPNPGFYADDYMAGYESELLDLADSWED